MEKVKTSLQQIVRDWSPDCASEREVSHPTSPSSPLLSLPAPLLSFSSPLLSLPAPLLPFFFLSFLLLWCKKCYGHLITALNAKFPDVKSREYEGRERERDGGREGERAGREIGREGERKFGEEDE